MPSDGASPDDASTDAGSAPAVPLNATDTQLETFFTTYGGRQSFPASYVTFVEALLRAEDEVEHADFAAARARIERVFSDYPLSVPVWWSGVGQAGANVGLPVAYYGLRMLDEITARAPAATTSSAHTLRMTVVLPKCAQGVRPINAELSQGETVQLSLHPTVTADDHSVIRQSLRIFQHYIWAITAGALRLEPRFVSVDHCVAVVYRANPAYSGIENESVAIDQVAADVQETTDMWWVLYPSNVPDGPQFDKVGFITGGMESRGRAPVFIADDLSLVRKPSHLGRGPYTDVERRLYLPQWLQHEFFHHLFRSWPTLGLEAQDHQWLDRKTWPPDFVGEWEPDYYAEALRKRLYQASPSLTRGLRVAIEVFDPSVLSAQDFVGSYERRPVENDWHRVTITLEAGELVWRNAGGGAWGLTWSNGTLVSAPDGPYGQQQLAIEARRDANGNPIREVRALRFNREDYLRL